MVDRGTIGRACAILDALVRGAVHDRATIAKVFGCGLAAADRYIRELRALSGVVSFKVGKRRVVVFRFAAALASRGIA